MLFLSVPYCTHLTTNHLLPQLCLISITDPMVEPSLAHCAFGVWAVNGQVWRASGNPPQWLCPLK